MKRKFILLGTAIVVIGIGFKLGVDYQTLRGEIWSINAYIAILQRADLLRDVSDPEVKNLKEMTMFLIRRNILYVDKSHMNRILTLSKRGDNQVEKARDILARHDTRLPPASDK